MSVLPAHTSQSRKSSGAASQVVRLQYDPPFDWPATLGFLTHRAIEGVEQVEGEAYWRTIGCGEAIGTLRVEHDPVEPALICTIALAPEMIPETIVRLRRMFDLDADLATIYAHLSRDPSLAPLVAARPALRVFGGWDPFEVAARSIFGQQVSVGRARQLNGTLAARCGSPADPAARRATGARLGRLFPTPRRWWRRTCRTWACRGRGSPR